MSKVAHVLIPVIDTEVRGPEEVEVESLGGNRYRILCPPRFAYGLAVGDEIEIDETARFGFRTLRRSGNLTVWFYAPVRGAEDGLALAARAPTEEIGATIEGTPDSMMIVTVPLAVGWQRIAAVMDAIAATTPGTSWEYANVYGPVDGKTPLGWWNER